MTKTSRQKSAYTLAPANEGGHVIGEAHWRAKLTNAEVDLILELRDSGLTYREIASKWDAEVTISVSTVRDICLGRRRSQVAVRMVRRKERRIPR